MTALKVGADGFKLDASATEDVIAILGRRGRGKTTTATVLVEGLHETGARFVVADPVGVWHGLKSSRDGQRPGIPVVVMGGDHGDVPLAAESGELIADFVADPSSPSVVLDLKLFSQGELVRFMTAFLARLYQVNPGKPLHVVLDEADQFAPQRPMPGEQAMLGAAQRVTKLGRAKGLHPILITQRPATLSKNVLTQAGLLIAHAITGPQDRKAVDEWIKANAEEGEREKFLTELAGLPKGTAYFWSPDIPLFRQVAVRDRHTFDSSATPKRGERGPKPKALAEVDLAALRERIAATIEHHKANDPRELRRTVAELRKQLAAKAPAQAPKTAPEPKPREVSVLKAADLKRLEALAGRVEKDLGRTEAVIDRLSQSKQALLSELGNLRTDLQRAFGQANRPQPQPPPAHRATTAPVAGGPARPPAAPPSPRVNADGIAPVEQRILDALAELQALGIETAERAQLALLAGYTHPQSTGFVKALGSVRTAGLVDYRPGGLVLLTTAGAERAEAAASPTTSAELQARLLKMLDPVHERVLRPLLAKYPGSIERVYLANAAGYGHVQSTGFVKALGRLRSLGLVDYPTSGTVAARSVLFLDGR